MKPRPPGRVRMGRREEPVGDPAMRGAKYSVAETMAFLEKTPFSFSVTRRTWRQNRPDGVREAKWLVSIEWWRFKGKTERAFKTNYHDGATLHEAMLKAIWRIRCEVCRARGSVQMRALSGNEYVVCCGCLTRPEAECAASLLAKEARAKAEP